MTMQKFENQLLPNRAVVSVRGETAIYFLDNLLTCSLENLSKGHAAYGALLSPQGKIQHDIFVFNAGDQILIDCAASHRESLFTKLIMYRLRAKLEIKPRDDLEIGAGEEGFVDPRHAGLGHRFFAAKGTFDKRAGYDSVRIMIGLADSDEDIGSNELFPHEANFDQFAGVSFTKGCYVGQEVVSRMQHRGTARSRILPITGQGLVKGAPITSGDKTIGEILSTADSHALALLRLDRLAEAGSPLHSNTAALKVQKPDWIKYEVSVPDVAK